MPHILIIDDAPDLALMLRIQLERAGHSVVTAENGRRGLRRFYEERPSLVVLDVRMPELDGWQTLERLRDLSDVPVVMHSGNAAGPDELARLRPDHDAYVRKPARAHELIAVIERLLGPGDPGGDAPSLRRPLAGHVAA